MSHKFVYILSVSSSSSSFLFFLLLKIVYFPPRKQSYMLYPEIKLTEYLHCLTNFTFEFVALAPCTSHKVQLASSLSMAVTG